MNVVISQPMLFPWVGMLEQVRLADVYVHYSDVQFSKGSFVNRVQIKSSAGTHWLTVPLKDLRLGQRINEVHVREEDEWRRRHLDLLTRAYVDAPYCSEMLSIVRSVYAQSFDTIAELSEASLLAVCRYFGLDQHRRFVAASDLGVKGSGSKRVLDIVLALGGDCYITGWGARDYLDHDLFEQGGVRVEYMNYRKMPYPQRHGEFTPFVSSLDLIANMGAAGKAAICSDTVFWKDFV